MQTVSGSGSRDGRSVERRNRAVGKYPCRHSGQCPAPGDRDGSQAVGQRHEGMCERGTLPGTAVTGTILCTARTVFTGSGCRQVGSTVVRVHTALQHGAVGHGAVPCRRRQRQHATQRCHRNRNGKHEKQAVAGTSLHNPENKPVRYRYQRQNHARPETGRQAVARPASGNIRPLVVCASVEGT